MRWFFFLLLSIIGLDRFTKQLAILFLRNTGESITIIPGMLSFTYAENRGIAFGMEFLPPSVLLALTTIIVSGVIFYTLRQENPHPLFLASFGLIAGGGIGNLIDRFTTGRVVDFIYFDLYRGRAFRPLDITLAHIQHSRFGHHHRGMHARPLLQQNFSRQ